MYYVSCRDTFSHTKIASHCLCGVMNSLTFRSLSLVFHVSSFTLKPAFGYTQGSSKTRIASPVPIVHNPSRFITFLPCMRLLHTHDALPPPLASRKLPLRKYNPFKIRTQMASGSANTRVVILVSNDVLKLWSSWNPSSPEFLEVVRTSNFLQCVFFPSAVNPHQKSAMSELIYEHQVLGRWKTLLTYIGIVVMIAFIKTSSLLGSKFSTSISLAYPVTYSLRNS